MTSSFSQTALASAAGPPHRAATHTVPRLARCPTGVRWGAFAVALVATFICLGSQVGLVALYSGDAEAAFARLWPSAPAIQTVASALGIRQHLRSPSKRRIAGNDPPSP